MAQKLNISIYIKNNLNLFFSLHQTLSFYNLHYTDNNKYLLVNINILNIITYIYIAEYLFVFVILKIYSVYN